MYQSHPAKENAQEKAIRSRQLEPSSDMQALLAEYLTNGDTLEASKCLMELGVPYYHHELVKRALVMAADDSTDHDAPLLLKLLSELASSGAINQVCPSLLLLISKYM